MMPISAHLSQDDRSWVQELDLDTYDFIDYPGHKIDLDLHPCTDDEYLEMTSGEGGWGQASPVIKQDLESMRKYLLCFDISEL